jgi:hypothetical protein
MWVSPSWCQIPSLTGRWFLRGISGVIIDGSAVVLSPRAGIPRWVVHRFRIQRRLRALRGK